jgi:hypothetical protein
MKMDHRYVTFMAYTTNSWRFSNELEVDSSWVTIVKDMTGIIFYKTLNRDWNAVLRSLWKAGSQLQQFFRITLSKVLRCLQNKWSVALCLDCIKSSGTFSLLVQIQFPLISLTHKQGTLWIAIEFGVWVSFSKCLFDLFIV